jgi:hypothetical protein
MGTILAQIFLIHNFSVSIKQTVSPFMFSSSEIVLTLNLRSDPTSSLTRAVLSPFRVADGRPLRRSTSTTILPSENILCQRKAYALDIASSPCVVVALSPSLTQQGWQTLHFAMFHASISMTRFTNIS